MQQSYLQSWEYQYFTDALRLALALEERTSVAWGSPESDLESSSWKNPRNQPLNEGPAPHSWLATTGPFSLFMITNALRESADDWNSIMRGKQFHFEAVMLNDVTEQTFGSRGGVNRGGTARTSYAGLKWTGGGKISECWKRLNGAVAETAEMEKRIPRGDCEKMWKTLNTLSERWVTKNRRKWVGRLVDAGDGVDLRDEKK